MADKNLKKIIITGGEGIIGSYFNFGTRLGHKDLEITDKKNVDDVFKKFEPEIVIHLAAATDVEKCEKDPEQAWLVNTWGTLNIAKACRENATKLVYISTAVVFSGGQPFHAEADLPFPQNVYGRTKYAAELLVQDLVPDNLIIRTSWVFGGGPKHDHKFVSKIIGQIKNNAKIRAVNDHIGSPTFAKDFVECLRLLLEEDKKGIFHIVNSGQASRYDMAKEIVAILKPQLRVEPVSYKEFGLGADRASSEVLVSKLPPLRPWQEALRDYLETQWKFNLKNER